LSASSVGMSNRTFRENRLSLPGLPHVRKKDVCREQSSRCLICGALIIVRGMARPSAAPRVRQPAVAGTFYPADERECRSLANAFVRDGGMTVDVRDASGAIVPHAGWICSGAIAGQAIAALAKQAPDPDIVVVFGAVHTPLPIDIAALASHASWHEPAGDSAVAQDVSRRLTEAGELFAIDDRFHEREHAVEVELPLIQIAWPNARVLPIEVPLTDDAAAIGRRVAGEVHASGQRAVFLASSDLTHYGPAYGFAPAGVGVHGLAWAKENDRRLLDLVQDVAVRSRQHSRPAVSAVRCGRRCSATQAASRRSRTSLRNRPITRWVTRA
jgi:AmmeMemoRadiSam system protein B